MSSPHATVRRLTQRFSGQATSVGAATIITLSGVPAKGYIARFHVTSGSDTVPVLSENATASVNISQILAISAAGQHHDEVPAEGVYYEAAVVGGVNRIYLKPATAAGTTTVDYAIDIWIGG
tara:strand:- start:320 stop:685 length:366 start_codon:yes stop_codon:yes gene_type:complete